MTPLEKKIDTRVWGIYRYYRTLLDYMHIRYGNQFDNDPYPPEPWKSLLKDVETALVRLGEEWELREP